MSQSNHETQDSIAALRKEYTQQELLESQVSPDPGQQFDRWFKEAIGADLPEPNAMHLATCVDGQPSSRIVLLKNFDAEGLQFFTNYESRKGEELAQNPKASLLFFWQGLERQVRIQGEVHRLSRDESRAYFHSRPRASQLGAWASKQSGVIPSRETMQEGFEHFEAKFAGGDVPLPDFWGGYRLVPSYFEFWQGGQDRLHDRLCYRLADAGAGESDDSPSSWVISRLSA